MKTLNKRKIHYKKYAKINTVHTMLKNFREMKVFHGKINR